MSKYVVADGQTIWHSQEDKYYTGGQEIDLSHLSPQGLAALLATGSIIELEKKPEKAKVKDE